MKIVGYARYGPSSAEAKRDWANGERHNVLTSIDSILVVCSANIATTTNRMVSDAYATALTEMNMVSSVKAVCGVDSTLVDRVIDQIPLVNTQAVFRVGEVFSRDRGSSCFSSPGFV